MIVAPRIPNALFACSILPDRSGAIHFIQFASQNQSSDNKNSVGGDLQKQIFSVVTPQVLQISGNGEYGAIVNDFGVSVFHLDKAAAKRPDKKAYLRFLKSSAKLTVCAVNQDASVVAAGDKRGKIAFWRGVKGLFVDENYIDKLKRMSRSEMHWHQQAISGVAFTLDGKLCLSVGVEAVLLKSEVSTGRKNYFAHLGGRIKSVLPHPKDVSKCCLVFEDNYIKLVNHGTFSVDMVIEGMMPTPPRILGYSEVITMKGCLHRGTGFLVLAGSNASLQFYDIVKDCGAAKLVVSQRPFQPVTIINGKEDFERYNTTPELVVTHVAFDTKGSIMATIHVSPGCGPVQPNVYHLKFWDKNGDTIHSDNRHNPYLLNTKIDDPHLAKVTGLAFHSNQMLAGSCSEEGEFKLWQTMNFEERDLMGKSRNAPKFYWTCRSVGTYMDSPMYSLGFSFGSGGNEVETMEQDDTVLAVGCKGCITLWKTVQNLLFDKLTFPLDWETWNVTQILFLKDTPVLVGLFEKQGVAVWDFFRGTILWCMTLPVTAIEADLRGRGFYAAVADGPDDMYAFFFSEGSPQPLKSWKISGSLPVAICSVGPDNVPLYEKFGGKKWDPVSLDPVVILSDNGYQREFYMLAQDEAYLEEQQLNLEDNADSKRKKQDEEMESSISAFQAMFGQTQDQMLQMQQSSEERQKWYIKQQQSIDIRKKIDSLFDGPAYMLPKPSVLMEQYFELTQELSKSSLS